MISVENVKKSFGTKKNVKLVLDNVNMKIKDGEIVGLLGKSGAGKSTLARIMKGEFLLNEGNVFADYSPLFMNGKYNAKTGMAIQVVPQQPYASLDPIQKVGKGLVEVLVANKIFKKKEAKDKALELMKKMNLSEDLFDRLPSQLSGGQAQRFVIARALSLSPKLLVSDESTSMLDVVSQSQILKIYQEIAENGTSILMISHDKAMIEFVCNRIYEIENGKIFELENELESKNEDNQILNTDIDANKCEKENC